MKRIRLMVGLGAVGLGLGGAVVAACGDNAAECGPGTVLVSGVCQVAPGDGSTLDGVAPLDGADLDGAPPDDAATDGTASDGGPIGDAAQDAPNRCPFGKGPVMAEIPNLIWDAGTFCIDTTEVSEAQYAQFIQSIGGPTGDAGAQPAGCGLNTSYAPGPTVQFGSYTYDPVKNPNLPVRGIDWCDAYSYCKWAGKRLCGTYDKSLPDPADAGSWKLYETNITCAQNGNQLYAYGNTFQSGLCPPAPLGDASPVAVGTSKCIGTTTPYSGVFDTSGNVSEWYGSCSANQAACAAGGTFECKLVTIGQGKTDRLVDRGVRCCAD